MASITISSVGNENTYITLILRHLDAKFELVTELTIYYPLSGRYEDEAVEAATDLEWAAQAKLKVLDVTDFWKEPGGFPETLERVFQTSTSHAIAAE